MVSQTNPLVNKRFNDAIKLDYVPNGLKEINEYYGNPDANKDFDLDPDWYRENTTVMELPFYMRQSWGNHKKVYNFRVHKLVLESLKDALIDIASYYGEKFYKEKLDYTGGTYNFRYKRGKEELSVHSWGIAIDLLPNIGCMGCDPKNFPTYIVEAFKQRNWIWGGDFNYPDPMHFQACKGY